MFSHLIFFYSCNAQTYFTNYRTTRDFKHKEKSSKEYKLNKFAFEKDVVEWFVGYNLVPMEMTDA